LNVRHEKKNFQIRELCAGNKQNNTETGGKATNSQPPKRRNNGSEGKRIEPVTPHKKGFLAPTL
jgi:hypothetical protein